MRRSKELEDFEFFKRFYETAPIGFYRTCIKTGLFLKANPFCARLLDTTPEQLINKEYSARFYPAEVRNQLLNKLREKGIVQDFEIALNIKSEIIWVAITARIYEKEGYLEGSMMDINDRKNIELQLEEMRNKQILELNKITKTVKTRLLNY